MLYFDLAGKTLILMLEMDKISWESYAQMVPEEERPHEYKDLASFTRNKGKASKRLFKEDEWSAQEFKNRQE